MPQARKVESWKTTLCIWAVLWSYTFWLCLFALKDVPHLKPPAALLNHKLYQLKVNRPPGISKPSAKGLGYKLRGLVSGKKDENNISSSLHVKNPSYLSMNNYVKWEKKFSNATYILCILSISFGDQTENSKKYGHIRYRAKQYSTEILYGLTAVIADNSYPRCNY